MANLPSLWRDPFFGERRDPYRAMERMRQEMDDLFESFVRDTLDFPMPRLAATRFHPTLDMEDKDTHYLLSFDVPGMSKDDIKLEVRENQLHVCGARKQEHEERQGRRQESERYYGSFDRWLTLPANTKAESIEARIENGVLQVAIPKAEATKGREIRIGEAKSGFFGKLIGKKEQVA